MSKVVHRKKRLSSFKLIVLGFAAVIFVGALLLMLPVSSVSGTQTPFHEALFTSVSAVCVTGLVVQDTGSYWSSFGQAVILLLIQIGGLGVITGAVTFLMLAGRNITLKEYIDRYRVNHARTELLMPGDSRSMEEIAVGAGFTSSRTFSRIFQKILGVTPAQYRRQAQ